MLYLFKLLFLLINIDQETVLNWFGIEDPVTEKARHAMANGYDLNLSTISVHVIRDKVCRYLHYQV